MIHTYKYPAWVETIALAEPMQADQNPAARLSASLTLTRSKRTMRTALDTIAGQLVVRSSKGGRERSGMAAGDWLKTFSCKAS